MKSRTLTETRIRTSYTLTEIYISQLILAE